MRKKRLVDTEVGSGRGGFSFATTSYDWISDLVTVLWLSRPERKGWRGGQHWHRQADRRTDQQTDRYGVSQATSMFPD